MASIVLAVVRNLHFFRIVGLQNVDAQYAIPCLVRFMLTLAVVLL